MKLIAYHIENYGKIHNLDGVFDKGLTEFCENNGFGKTTMASFIRAMFYGLPTYTARSKTFDDRQHFYPFAGGKFGGNITFEMQGKTYKIERFFDKKSATGDELKVYFDGAPYTGFGEDIGKEVFGLDEESFKKTVFITADEIEIESTHSINEKLNRDVQGGEDNDFQAAIDGLEKAKKTLKAGRGNNDLISQKRVEILSLNDQIKNLKDMSDSLTDEYVERERLTKEIASQESELKRAGERDLVLQKWETLDNLVVQTQQKTAVLNNYKEKYPSGLPSEEERKTLNVCIQEETRLSGTLQAASFGQDKENALALLQEKFKNGAPRDEMIAQKQQALTQLSTLQAEQNNLQNCEKTAREKALEKKFGEQLPTENELLKKREVVEEYKRKDAQLKELHASLVNSAPAQAAQGGKAKYLLWVLAALAMIGGIVLIALQQLAIGVGAAVLGVVLFAVGFLFNKKSSVAGAPSDITVRISQLQAELRVLEESLRAFTVPYGYYGDAGVLYDFATLEEDVKAYRAQVAAEQERAVQAETLSRKIDEITKDVQLFLHTYNETDFNLQNGLHRLLTAVSNYNALLADKAAASGKSDEVQARILQYKNTIESILKKYGFDAYVGTMDGLKALELDCKSIVELEADVSVLTENLTNYQEKNGLTERPTGEVFNTDALRESLSLLRKQLADCDKRIAETERLVEKLPDVESELERAEEKFEEYKNRYDLLSDTATALQEAEKALQDRYVAPIKDKFSVYAEALERVLDEKITMDSDYHVKFERGGQQRSDKHLSAGERSLCALCLRLALIDNMYEAEQPFIVMDDPFVHLDKTHMGRTVELINELAKTRQIVYFCCHESRSIAAADGEKA